MDENRMVFKQDSRVTIGQLEGAGYTWLSDLDVGTEIYGCGRLKVAIVWDGGRTPNMGGETGTVHLSYTV